MGDIKLVWIRAMASARHTRKAFDSDLQNLSRLLAEMGELAETQVENAVEALASGDRERARRLIAADCAIDTMQRTIDEKVVELIARRQPVAVDLREALGILRIANELERIGDLAKNIGKRIPAIPGKHLIRRSTPAVRSMGLDIARQLGAALDGFAHRDFVTALDVWVRDAEIDQVCTTISRDLLACMAEDPDAVMYGIHLLFCAKNLERIGDHATNIAESVHYMVKGQVIPGERPKADLTCIGAPHLGALKEVALKSSHPHGHYRQRVG